VPAELAGPRIAKLIRVSSEWAHFKEGPRDDGKHPEDKREREDCADEFVHFSSFVRLATFTDAGVPVIGGFADARG
jgi:hypothetical protein